MSKPNWFSIFDRGAVAEILIYHQIDKDLVSQDGVSAKDFAAALKPYAAKDLVVGINSPGGNVFDGIAIANQLSMHKGHVSTRNDGLVASIASVIFLAGKSRTVAENSMTMIHDPSGAAAGRSQDLRAMADVLDQVKNTLAETYVKASGRSKTDVLAAMAEEKRFTAAEAIEWKFADAITPTLKAAASFDLSVFKNTIPDPVAQLRNDLLAERTKRITREIDDFIAERRVTADKRSFWIAECLKNEAMIETLRAMPQILPPEGLNNHQDQDGIPQNASTNAYRAYRASLDKFRNIKRN